MSCRQWALNAAYKFQGLCGMTVESETANPTMQCKLCVTPIVAAVACGGTATYQVQEVIVPPGLTQNQWVLIEDNCTGTGTPVPPATSALFEDVGTTQTTECSCP